MKSKLICMDLDGTLFDTVPEMCNAANQVMDMWKLKPVTVDIARNYVGDGLARFMKRVLTGQMWAEPPANLLIEALDAIHSCYPKFYLTRNSLYPGVARTLPRLQEEGWLLSVVTNKSVSYAGPMLSEYLPDIAFSCVLGGDSGLPRKPDPSLLREAMSQVGAEPGNTLMVGDSISDARAAKAASVCAMVGASYGYGQEKDLASASDYMIGGFAELPSVCSRALLH